MEIDQESRGLRLLTVQLVEQEVMPPIGNIRQLALRVVGEEVVAQAGRPVEAIAVEGGPERRELTADERLPGLGRGVRALVPAVVAGAPPEHGLRLGAERDPCLPCLLEERIGAPRDLRGVRCGR